MKLTIEHIALSVTNLERSIAFYRDVIGFKVIRIIECTEKMKLGNITGMPGCIARIAHLQSGKIMLEIFEYKYPKGKKNSNNRKQADHGLIHIGFTSTNIHADYKRLKKLSVKFFNMPIEFRQNVWIVYFYGPDNEVCELRQT